MFLIIHAFSAFIIAVMATSLYKVQLKKLYYSIARKYKKDEVDVVSIKINMMNGLVFSLLFIILPTFLTNIFIYIIDADLYRSSHSASFVIFYLISFIKVSSDLKIFNINTQN